MKVPRVPRALRKIGGALFAAAVLFFLALFIVRHGAQVREQSWSLRPGLFILSLAVNIASLGWGVRVWQLVLAQMGVATGYRSIARVWFLSGLGRYIPGKIWQFVGAAHLGGGAGMSPSVSVTSLALHSGFFLLSATITALVLTPEQIGGLGEVTIRALRLGAPLLLLLAHPAMIRLAVGVMRRISRARIIEWRGSWRDGIRLTVLAFVGWIGSGIALFLFLLSTTPLPLTAAPGIVGVNAFAFLVGVLVFIAPAGLGAKEGAMTALLALYMPIGVAALLAVAARLWAIAAELLPALFLLRNPERAALRPTSEGSRSASTRG